MKEKKQKILIIIALIFLAFIVINKNLNSVNFASITYGRGMLEEGKNIYNNYSFIVEDEFENPNWFLDLVLAKTYMQFGFLGVYIFYIVLTSVFGMTIYYLLVKKYNNQLLAFLFVSLLLILSKKVFNNIICSMSLFILILEVHFISKWINTMQKRYLLFTFIVVAILTNINASVYPITLLLLIPFLIEMIYKKSKKMEDNGDYYLISIAFIVIFIAGSVNPLKWTPYLNIINIWRMYNKVVLLSDYYYIFLVAILPISYIVNKYIKDSATIIVIISIAIICIGVAFILLNINKEFVDPKQNPVLVSEYIVEKIGLNNFTIVHDSNIGDYLEFKNIPVFNDSKKELLLSGAPEYLKLRALYEIKDGKRKYTEFCQKQNIKYFLIAYNDIIFNKINNDLDWNLVYNDDYFYLYEINK